MARDHAESFADVESGRADAFATDAVLLYRLIAQNKAKAKYQVIGEFLSYDPHGMMYRKGDAQFAQRVNASTSAGSCACRRATVSISP